MLGYVLVCYMFINEASIGFGKMGYLFSGSTVICFGGAGELARTFGDLGSTAKKG